MNASVFVGGFPYETTEEALSALFRTCGTVKGVKILVERQTGRSRGLGFVDMATEAEARQAIVKLNGSFMGSRKIFVSEARPQEKSSGGLTGRSGFVERRSGKERRQNPPADAHRRERPFERKKPSGDKPSLPRKKPWEKRPAYGGDKSRGEGPAADKPPVPRNKPWERRPGGPGAGNKWGGKPRKFGGLGKFQR